MKSIKIFKRMALLIFFIIIISLRVNAQIIVPPPPPDGHGSETDQLPEGESAPIGSGLFILLGLGAAYGGKKIYDAREKLKELN